MVIIYMMQVHPGVGVANVSWGINGEGVDLGVGDSYFSLV